MLSCASFQYVTIIRVFLLQLIPVINTSDNKHNNNCSVTIYLRPLPTVGYLQYLDPTVF